MSAIWGNPENIYSLRVLPPVTLTGPSSARPGRTTGEQERLQLQPVPTLYGGRSARAIQAQPEPAPIIGVRIRSRCTTSLPAR